MTGDELMRRTKLSRHAAAPVQGLKYAWKKANGMQQAWLRETLAQHGVAISDLVDN